MLKKPQPAATTAMPTNELGSSEVVQEWVDATMKTAISLDARQYIPQFWRQKTRPDGRILGQARTTTIVPGVLERNALGSALVKFSTTSSSSSSKHSTHVLAGVTAEIGQPSANEGDLKLSLLPQNSVLESWLLRILLASLDLEQLGIVTGKTAFGLDISIVVLNQNGNVADACLLAAMAALRNTRLPVIVLQDGRVYTLDDDNDETTLNNIPTSMTTFESKPLSLPVLPLPLTMGVANFRLEDEHESRQHWLVDPSKEEEKVCEGSIKIVVNGLETDQILSLEYQGNVSITHSSLALAVQMAKGRVEELLPLLKDK